MSKELKSMIEEILKDVKGITEEEIELIYYCHLYGASGAKGFPGHQLITVIYKLGAHIARKRKKL